MKRLDELFYVSYGNKLDLNKMRRLSVVKGGVHFVGRSSGNHGVSASVAPLKGVDPYEGGLITVALGGTKLLSSFVQETPFYTAQNVAILKPKAPMSFTVKLFMCLFIRHNRFRYSAFGREANRTLKELLVPERKEFPNWGQAVVVAVDGLAAPIVQATATDREINVAAWRYFELQEIFDIERGRGPRKKDLTSHGNTPLITAIDSNNGLTGFTTMKPCHRSGTISVNRNGNGVAEAFYQPKAFCSTEDVHIFNPKFPMNPFSAFFLTTLIRREKYRFGYGRKWGIARMKRSRIKLPTDSCGAPDWKYMERYIMSLPFSSQITDRINERT